MKKIALLTACSLFIFATSCKKEKKEAKEVIEETVEEVKEEVEEVMAKEVKFPLEAKSDSGVTGEVTFREEGGKVMMVAYLSGLTEGEHAIHLHEKADCSSADGKSTGGHWNPTHQPHGKWGASEGYHKGDIGNFKADAEGKAKVTFETDQWCIGCDDPNKNILGKAVIVHQGVDDFTSQPSGAAGARISCAGIIE
ncbi:superoxide dismutase family protein [Sungkyunkwania multivorans]|uniref:Superoxide dismutase family protein n=1 Tax=Sungkyunkwania multivorans TaxID=1173618 RepID=A0ABW3CW23_9FLAO